MTSGDDVCVVYFVDMGEESPPEPAPPEVPPRGPSLLHPTLRGVAAAAAAAAAAAEGVDYHTAAGGIPGTGAPTGLYVGTGRPPLLELLTSLDK